MHIDRKSRVIAQSRSLPGQGLSAKSRVIPKVECEFCADPNPVLSNGLAFVRMDRFPVSPGHALVLPIRHVADYFDLTTEERAAISELLPEAKRLLEHTHKPAGYNIGINVGEAAGQSIWHVHVHIIPRYWGD